MRKVSWFQSWVMFLDLIPNIRFVKEKPDILNFIDIKNFCSVKVYMTSYTMERIFANHIIIKEQHLENIKKIHIYNQKQLMLEKLDAHKQIYNQKMSRLHEHFTKEDKQMVNRHRKRCLTSLTIKQTQIKTTMRCRCLPLIMTKIRNRNNTKCWERCGKPGSLIHC